MPSFEDRLKQSMDQEQETDFQGRLERSIADSPGSDDFSDRLQRSLTVPTIPDATQQLGPSFEDIQAEYPEATNKRRMQDLSRMLRIMQETGIEEDYPEGPSPLERVTDLFMRFPYAFGGFMDEVFQSVATEAESESRPKTFDDFVKHTFDAKTLKRGIKRAYNEFFTPQGLVTPVQQNSKAKKKKVAEVLRDVGAQDSFHASDIPFLGKVVYRTGDGWRGPWDFRPTAGGAFDPSNIDLAGFGLEVASDPTTWIGFGVGDDVLRVFSRGGLGTKVLKRQAFSRAGINKINELAAEEMPEAVRYVSRLIGANDDYIAAMQKAGVTDPVELFRRAIDDLPFASTDEVVKAARENAILSHEFSRRAATARVSEMIDQGATKLADVGGVKWMGRTILPLNKVPGGEGIAQSMRRLREMLPSADMFRGTTMTATQRAGYREAKILWRAQLRSLRAQGAEVVDSIAQGWKKMPDIDVSDIPEAALFPDHVKNGKMKLTDYVGLAIEESGQARPRFPVDRLPGPVRDLIPKIQDYTYQMGLQEAHAGRIDLEDLLPSGYFPHIWNNRSNMLSVFEKAVVRNRGGSRRGIFSLGGFSEHRTFPTLVDAMQFASDNRAVLTEMAKEDGIKLGIRGEFRMRPVLDFRDAMVRRVDGHARAIAGGNFEWNLLGAMGFSKRAVREAGFRRLFPEVLASADNVYEQTIGRSTLDDRIRVARMLQDTTDPKAMWRMRATYKKAGKELKTKIGHQLDKLSPDGRALYWAGRLRQIGARVRAGEGARAEYMRQLGRLIDLHGDDLARIDGDAWGRIMTSLNRERIAMPNPFNEPTKLHKLRGRTYHVPAAIASDLERLDTKVVSDPAILRALAVFDVLNDSWKWSVTQPFVNFHFRNKYSNVAANFLDIGLKSLDPVFSTKVAMIGLGKDVTINNPGLRYTGSEVMQFARKYGVITGGEQITERASQRVATTTPGLLRRVTRLPEKAAGAIESWDRLINFTANLERGLDPAQAALRTHNFLFDYDELSPVEREVMKRLFPFYTWPKKNVALLAREMKRRPGLVGIPFKLADKDRGPDEAMLPLYVRGELRVKLRSEPGKGSYLLGIDLPITSAIDTIFDDRLLLGNLNPILKGLIELSTKKQIFSGRDLTERERLGPWIGKLFEKAPDRIKSYVGFDKREDPFNEGRTLYEMNGTKAYLLLKASILSRYFTTTRRFSQLLEQEGMPQALVYAATGLGFKEFDLSEMQERQLAQRLKAAQKKLREDTSQVGTFEKTYELK